MIKGIQKTTCAGGHWDIELTEEEIGMLAKGIDPRLIKPANLIKYWPIRATDFTFLSWTEEAE